MTPDDFKLWLKQRHLTECAQCQRTGEGRIMDADALAYALFQEYYEYKQGQILEGE